MLMKATQRLFLTAGNVALVAENHRDAAFLYAAVGDEIPDDIVAKFGLVDGALPPIDAEANALMRIATIGGVASIVEAGITFGPMFLFISDGQIDEGQFLAILKNVELQIEVEPIGSNEWIAIPHRDEIIAALQFHVDYDLAHGRPHDRVTARAEDDLQCGLDPHPAAVAALAAVGAPPPPETPPASDMSAEGAAPDVATDAAKEAPAGEDKEQKGGEDKEQKGGSDKAARASRAKAAPVAPAETADAQPAATDAVETAATEAQA